ncbi:MAG: 2-oxo acid dehydrogenase subunit E2 [Phycisphaerales bacterium]|nr:2-oxo acid dehydrogenase subunit E2 [Phycisphaerales bacterium]MCB9836641.1 2-oxo acid dehydrogenase subunit E2 [Phycisphaera sp.]
MAGKVSSDPNVFLLPDIGEGLQEAELVKWLVSVGDTVEEGQDMAEVETDKALAEIPSPRKGVIKELRGNPGDKILVGDPFVIYEGGSAPAAAPKAEAPAPKAAEPAASAEEKDQGTVVGKVGDDLVGISAADGKALATPAVRRMARDAGIDINTVVGTGLGGRITKKDIESAASGNGRVRPASAPARRETMPVYDTPAPAPKREITPIPAGQETVAIPFRGVRRKIAERLRHSVNNAVHFTVMDEADITDLNALRKKLSAASGEKVSPLPFVASAICSVLSRDEFRALNANVDDANEQIVQHRAVHLGIAADTDSGLMVPVIRDCDALGVLEIGREVARVARAARDRSIGRDELMGSTFTLSNVGSHAGRFATPIINYPEVGILAAGRGREGMVVKNGMFRVGMLLPLSLACDHRVVDGATAALALAEIIKLLENPESLLAPARS